MHPFCHRYTDKYLGLESPHVSPLTTIQMCSPDHCYPCEKGGVVKYTTYNYGVVLVSK